MLVPTQQGSLRLAWNPFPKRVTGTVSSTGLQAHRVRVCVGGGTYSIVVCEGRNCCGMINVHTSFVASSPHLADIRDVTAVAAVAY